MGVRDPSRSESRIARRQGRAQDILELVRPVAILMCKEFFGHLGQPAGQGGGGFLHARSPTLPNDRTHGIDVMGDESDRDAAHVGRMLDEPAEAVGGDCDHRIAESVGSAPDVVGGEKQGITCRLREPACHDRVARLIEPIALGLHPCCEPARELRERLFGPRHRIFGH